MSDRWPAAIAPDSAAFAWDVHPTTAMTTAALITDVRAVFLIAFPSWSHPEAENAGQNQKGPKQA